MRTPPPVPVPVPLLSYCQFHLFLTFIFIILWKNGNKVKQNILLLKIHSMKQIEHNMNELYDWMI